MRVRPNGSISSLTCQDDTRGLPAPLGAPTCRVVASRSARLVPVLLAVRPRHGAVAGEDEVVGVVAGPDADLRAVGVDGDGWDAGTGEHQRSRRHVASVHDLVRSGRAGREAGEVTRWSVSSPSGPRTTTSSR